MSELLVSDDYYNTTITIKSTKKTKSKINMNRIKKATKLSKIVPKLIKTQQGGNFRMDILDF